jgi:broad specificity phosphatase PhoE
MVMLHLVRHARSAQDPNRPSWEWSLAEGAEADTERLRTKGFLPSNALWVSSTEPKAVATARLLTGRAVRLDDDLREAGRDPAWLPSGEFSGAVLRSFAEPERAAREGWEPLAVTQRRVLAAARAAVAEGVGRDVVLVGHGTAWTMLVAALTGQPPDVTGWESMGLPDHCAVEWPGRVVRPWGCWRA